MVSVNSVRINPAWYVQETLMGAFPHNVPMEKRFVASLYTLYMDDSGTHTGSDVTVVAGFVSNATQWGEFSKKWQEALSESRLEFFRMSEFENRRGQFSGWSENNKRDLLNRLLPIIDDHTFWSIGCIVLREWYDSILSDTVKKIVGGPYGLAALACWRNLGLIIKDADGWLDVSMEAGTRGSGALQLIYEEDSKFPEWHDAHRVLSLSFREKRVFLPLQAADILAYELYKQGARQFGQEGRPARYPLEVLGSKKHQWTYLQESHLEELNTDLTNQIEQYYRSR